MPSSKSAASVSSASHTATPTRSQTPRTSSPAPTAAPGGKAKVDDKYFATLGAANASRPADLPPSQGGKYAGFGSAPVERPKETGLPGIEDLQKDPVAALSRGFGWFAGAVGKTAKTVNEGYIQPTAAKVLPLPYPIPHANSASHTKSKSTTKLTNATQIAETDLAAQARQTAQVVARNAQTGAKSAADGFNRFVENSNTSTSSGSGRYREAPLDESKKDFWDSFADAGAQRSAVGTSAIKKNTSGLGGLGGGGGGTGVAGGKKDEWDDW